MSLSKEYILTTLHEERLWKSGESDTFSFGPWVLTLVREDDWALPFKFALHGSKSGTNETWSRRYLNMEQAFLHIFNRFNENANVKNRYATLDEALADEFGSE